MRRINIVRPHEYFREMYLKREAQAEQDRRQRQAWNEQRPWTEQRTQLMDKRRRSELLYAEAKKREQRERNAAEVKRLLSMGPHPPCQSGNACWPACHGPPPPAGNGS